MLRSLTMNLSSAWGSSKSAAPNRSYTYLAGRFHLGGSPSSRKLEVLLNQPKSLPDSCQDTQKQPRCSFREDLPQN
jgi:hypothetical protein